MNSHFVCNRDGILSNVPYKVSSDMITAVLVSEKSVIKGCIFGIREKLIMRNTQITSKF